MKEGILGYIFKHQERFDILSGKRPFNAESFSILVSPTNDEGQQIPVIMFSLEQLAAHDKRVAQESWVMARQKQARPLEGFEDYWAEQQARKGDAE